MNLETLLVIVAVVVAVVFNVGLPWLKKLQGDGLAGNTEPELQEVPTAMPAPELSAAPESVTWRDAPTRTPAPMASVAARPLRRKRLGSLSGMRDGIVLAAVLGPCRSQTPFV